MKLNYNNWSKILMDNFSNLSSTLDCSLTLSFRALCTRCRPSKFHVLISFHEREKGKPKKPTRLSSFTSHGRLSHWVLSWALTFILWRFSALPTSHAQKGQMSKNRQKLECKISWEIGCFNKSHLERLKSSLSSGCKNRNLDSYWKT